VAAVIDATCGTKPWPAALPVALLAVTPGGRLSRSAGVVLVLGYGAWVTAVLAR
jgi:hypothetical protein